MREIQETWYIVQITNINKWQIWLYNKYNYITGIISK